ncbi:hypothetical protein K439DRAFT_1611986 [Ramaria rubella]|nr:hypothetical protein K439DRAFT_1611986 [Ramaria rubella]
MVHDEAGISVEAAASLFDGGDEVAVDFFASNLDIPQADVDASQERLSSDTASNHFEAGPYENTSSLFQAAPDHSYRMDAIGQMDGRLEATFHNQVDSQVNYDPTAYQNQGWQDELGQWHTHDTNQYTPIYDYACTDILVFFLLFLSSHLSSAQPQSTNPYVPHTEYHPLSHNQTDAAPAVYATHYNNSQAYTPQHDYAPSEVQAQASYSSLPPTAPSGPYSRPAYKSYASNFQAKSPIHTNAHKGQAEQSVPKTKDITAYRPTTLDAYDPPLPSKTRSKARSALYASHSPTVFPNGNYYQRSASSQSPPAIPPPPPLPPVTAATTNVPPPSSSIIEPIDPVSPSLVTHTGVKQPPGNGTLYEENNSSRWQETGPTLQFSFSSSHGESDVHSASDMSNPQSKDLGDAFVPDVVYQWESTAQDSQDGATVFQGSGALVVDTSSDIHDPKILTTIEPTLPINKHSAYSSEVRPFGDDRPSTTPPSNSKPCATPPPLTGSPVDYSSLQQPHGDSHSGLTGDQPSYDPYHPAHHSRDNSNASHTRGAYPSAKPTSMKSGDSYAPPNVSKTSRKGSLTASSDNTPDTFKDQHSAHNDTQASITELPLDPYAPKTAQLHGVANRSYEASYDDQYTSRFNYSYDSQLLSAELDPPVDPITYAAVVSAPTYAPYAPSPSLLGTNDPLGRASARVPVISFGFGGKLVSCFHSGGESASGFDVSLTARQSTTVLLRTLHELIPASAMDSSASSYPGPLFSDPGASSISLARTVGVGNAANIKTKKALVMKWLEERSDELSSGVPYVSSGSQERHDAESKLVLVRLLKVMIDNDGQLSGSSSIDWAVRSVLIPRLDPEGAADRLSSKEHIAPSYVPVLADLNEPSLAVYHLRSSSLDRIQEFLLRGERRQAYHYAIDEKLWAHAMLIASSVDTQAWKEVVNEFLYSELTAKQQLGPSSGSKSEATASLTNGRESLRVAYSLFAGHGAAAVQELVPQRAIPANKDSLLAPPLGGIHNTPISPNFPQPALTSSVPRESLAKWQETAAMMIFSQKSGDSAALTALGDYLAANLWVEAAHACYLLSPRTSSLGGAGAPSVRIVLVGCESPNTLRNFHKDLDVTIFSEIVEFALSLSPSKGQDGFGGLPHLQAYKLIRASHLAEMGHVEAANRYCEAIGSTIRASNRGSQFYTPTFIGELKNLSDRLTAAPQMDKTASWISRKMTKPSLDTIGSWLEGRFSKLIVGEGEDNPEPPLNEPPQPPKPGYGPFSHYSTISSTSASATPSRSSTPNATIPTTNMGFGTAHTQIDRASSAMDHLRPEAQRTSPVPRVASASATTTTFAQGYNTMSRYRQDMRDAESEGASESGGQDVTWWGSSSHDGSGPTPTAATFHKIDEADTGSNFVSLMNEYSPGPTPIATSSHSRTQKDDVEDEEDLGFGNSSSKSKSAPKDEPKEKAKEQPKPAAEKPELKPQSSSWFGRWWGRGQETASTGPIKAKLGEETSFYYDKELKRWVNKKAATTETTSSPPPPPPSRPRTASPAPSIPPGSRLVDVSGPPTMLPHARPASATDVTMPPRRPPRVRSNLVPKEDSPSPGSAPPSATSFESTNSGAALGPPVGIGRPKSSASKRNVRSRYVDVFQQQSES